MRADRSFGALVLIALAGISAPAARQGESLPAADCTVTRLQGKAPQGTTITEAAMVEASGNVPRHCRVDGHVAVPGNTVNFRLGLPLTWNGKFYFQGVGGLGGTIGSLNTGLARGYASVSTDTGHQASDETWGQNRAKEIDYGHRGTHVTAVASKALTAAYYGRAPQHAYFNGCSNGGRQALMEVQRYPEDFDGIIAGHPATGTPMQVGRAVLYQHMLASMENYLPAGKVELLDRATLAECDVRDGLQADQFVRLFLPPGTHHCGGGPGPNTFDMLPALEEWVERGVPPARVVASHATAGRVDRTRPLCPHPQVARYTGSGSIDDAANFRCEAK